MVVELNRVLEGCLNTLFAECLGWFQNRGTEQGPNRVFGQTGCSNRVFAEHPRNRVFEVGEQGVCGVRGARKQGACFCPKRRQPKKENRASGTLRCVKSICNLIFWSGKGLPVQFRVVFVSTSCLVWNVILADGFYSRGSEASHVVS